jgi:pyruvate,water dikinase
MDYVRQLAELGMGDLGQVGGKNASLGEMLHHLTDAGVRVPDGFATTAEAYRGFLAQDGLSGRITSRLENLDVDDVQALAAAGQEIRGWIRRTPLPAQLEDAVRHAWARMSDGRGSEFSVAVRSSATAEDLPDASFAGQQETFLNVNGVDEVIAKMHEVFASLYNDRAIAYRVHQGYDDEEICLSAGVQRMVRSDIGSSGVMFTLDTESGFEGAVFITAAYGLGETVVQGAVNPDEYYVYKPALRAGHRAILRKEMGTKAQRMVYGPDGGVTTEDLPPDLAETFALSDSEIESLAHQALTIEEHYGRPMDIEWVRDGLDGEIYIVQARPETVKSREGQVIERYRITDARTPDVKVVGRSIGQRIGAGTAKIIATVAEMDRVQAGDVLVTDMTDPDWEPIMKRAAAIVTNRGGRTCHAAIIARELGIPAVVGCKDATDRLVDDVDITVSCAEGDTGYVYAEALEFEINTINLESMPPAPMQLMLNVANPDRAFDFAAVPNHGVGLARVEFIINRMIGVHPKALIEYDQQPAALREAIDHRIAGYGDPVDFYVERLAQGISMIAAAFDPAPVIVRLSDFKSNEYANLLGGRDYEPREENPMLGWRGASRYVSDAFRDCFELECRALRLIRNDMALKNVKAMIPFVRTVAEGKAVVDLMASHGLRRGEDGLEIVMMCELPSNALLADQFLDHFDGFSIGSNDLTQLTLGLDRDSGLVADLFDERDPAVKALLRMAIEACTRRGKYIGICGQGPSDHPDLAIWLAEQGIGSLSLNPDTVVETWLALAEHAELP